jgi:hypothetical protein
MHPEAQRWVVLCEDGFVLLWVGFCAWWAGAAEISCILNTQLSARVFPLVVAPEAT